MIYKGRDLLVEKIGMNILRRAFQDESSRIYHILNDAIAVIILFSVLFIILESVDSIYAQYKTFFATAEIFVVAIFTIEYFLRIYFSEKKWRYILSPMGIIDLVSFLPFYLIGFLPFLFDFHQLRVLRVLRVLRLLRLFRILKILASKRRHFETRKIFSALPWYNIEIYLFTLFSVVIISGTLIHLAEQDVPGTAFTSIPQGLWWAIVTATTVGYGDMVPVTTLGRIVAAFTMISGLSLFALLITVMGKTLQTALFGTTIDSEQKLSQRTKALSENGRKEEEGRKT